MEPNRHPRGFTQKYRAMPKNLAACQPPAMEAFAPNSVRPTAPYLVPWQRASLPMPILPGQSPGPEGVPYGGCQVLYCIGSLPLASPYLIPVWGERSEPALRAAVQTICRPLLGPLDGSERCEDQAALGSVATLLPAPGQSPKQGACQAGSPGRVASAFLGR